MVWSELYKIDKVPTNRQAFGKKVISISNEMGINPNWLMGLMYFETARSLDHKETNRQGCVGLIQFCSEARTELSVTASQLRNMTNLQQLDYVRRYFLGVAWKQDLVAKVRNVTDLYLIIFYPRACGKPMNYVLGSHNGTYTRIYNSNPSFKDGTGKVKVQNVVDKITSFLMDVDIKPTPPDDNVYDGGDLPTPVVTASRIENESNSGGGGLLLGFGLLLLLLSKNKKKKDVL